MKLIYSKKNEKKLLAESLDDLWYLSTIIEPGDLLRGKTLRKIKLGSEEDRKASIIKKPLSLTIRAEKIEFGNSGALRVSGKITEGPEDIQLGSYHSFSIEPGSALTLTKEAWLNYHIDRLKDATAEKKSKILVVVHDREEAYFAALKKYGYDILSHISGDVQKKGDMEKRDGSFYPLIAKQILAYDERNNYSNIIIASPAFWKEELARELRNDEIKKKIVFATCSSVGENAIDEVLKRPETKNALMQERSSEEMNAVDELLGEIALDNLAAYGIEDTENAVFAGAARFVLVTDCLIKKARDDGTYPRIESILKAVERSKGSVLIVSSAHEGGRRLDGIGGIASLLRYKMRYC